MYGDTFMWIISSEIIIQINRYHHVDWNILPWMNLFIYSSLDMNHRLFVILLQLICKNPWWLQWHNVKCIMLIWFYIKVEDFRRSFFENEWIFFWDMSPSIGTPPRFIQPPSISDTRLMIPTLTQNINNKWDSISLTDGILCFLEKFLLEKLFFFVYFSSNHV